MMIHRTFESNNENVPQWHHDQRQAEERLSLSIGREREDYKLGEKVVEGPIKSKESITPRKQSNVNFDDAGDGAVTSSPSSVSVSSDVRTVNHQRSSVVRFAPQLFIREVSNRAVLTDEDVQQRFVTAEDEKRTFQEIAATLRRKSRRLFQVGATTSGKPALTKVDSTRSLSSDGTDDSLRGLERVMEIQLGGGVSEASQTVVTTVLERQQSVGEIDEAWLRTCYRPITEGAAQLARYRAQRDEMSAADPASIPRTIRIVRQEWNPA